MKMYGGPWHYMEVSSAGSLLALLFDPEVEAVCSSKPLCCLLTTQRYNAEDHVLCSHHLDNL
jgi:hypothetical protein